MSETARGRVIGHVVLSLDVGGLERVVATLAPAQRSSGARVIVYCLDRAGDLAAPLPDAGVPVRCVQRSERGFDTSAVVRLARLLRVDGVDIVHCHNYGALVYGSLAARLAARARVVYTVHGAMTSQRRATGRFQKLGLVHEVVFVSAHARRMARGAGLSRDDHVHTVLNGIDAKAFPASGPARERIRREHGIPPDAPVCGIVARLTAAKDHRTLFDAMLSLRVAHPHAHCLVVGDGELRDELSHEISVRGLGMTVHMVGSKRNVTDYLAAMDVFVLSSVTEGLAMTLLEAMAAEKPVVATRVGGNPEVVIDGETGLLVPPRDPAAMADAIAVLMRRPELAARLGAAGRQRVVGEFSLEAMARNYDEIYAGARTRGSRHAS